MNNKGIVWTVVVLIVLIGLVVLFTGDNKPGQNAGTEPTSTQPLLSGTGRVVVAITDAAVGLETISKINMTIDEVSLRNASGTFTTVSSNDTQFDLLALKNSGQLALAADATIPAGVYNQVRVVIKDVQVVKKAGGTITAKLPSGEFKYNTNMTVQGGSTNTISLDFLADASLHLAGNGTYIFAPVVHTEHRTDATVTAASSSTTATSSSIQLGGRLTISGGSVSASATQGMDVDGTVKQNFKIDSGAKVDIQNGVIKVTLPSSSQNSASSSILNSGGVNINTGAGGGVNVGY
jgi:hypothetical protein